jgi:hypothetical protein
MRLFEVVDLADRLRRMGELESIPLQVSTATCRCRRRRLSRARSSPPNENRDRERDLLIGRRQHSRPEPVEAPHLLCELGGFSLSRLAFVASASDGS